MTSDRILAEAVPSTKLFEECMHVWEPVTVISGRPGRCCSNCNTCIAEDFWNEVFGGDEAIDTGVHDSSPPEAQP
jgi:hypothetical protein